MKVLVFQVRINNEGYASSLDREYKDVDKINQAISTILRPSVQSYCKKYNYDYKLIEHKPSNINIDWFRNVNTYPARDNSTTLVRYLLDEIEDYDYILSLDNDIYVTPHAESLPLIPGYSGVSATHLSPFYSSNSKYDSSLIKRCVINGGVQLFDIRSYMMIKKFFISLCEKQILPPNIFFSDQYYINDFRFKNHSISNVLSTAWNFMDKVRESNYKNLNFIHYCGPPGRYRLLSDIQQSILL